MEKRRVLYRVLLLGLLALSVSLAGCAPPTTPVPPATPEPPATPMPTDTPESPDAPSSDPGLTPEREEGIADAARAALAQELGVDPSAISVSEVTAQEWRDSCLGLADAGEFCLQVITPGFRVLLTVDGCEYEVRTNQDGSVVRIAG